MEGWWAEYVDTLFKFWCGSISIVCAVIGNAPLRNAEMGNNCNSLELLCIIACLPGMYLIISKNCKVSTRFKMNLSLFSIEVLEVICLDKMNFHSESDESALLYINLLFTVYQLPYLLSAKYCILGFFKHLVYFWVIQHKQISSYTHLNISFITSLVIVLVILYRYTNLLQLNYELKMKQVAMNHVGSIMNGVSEGVLLLNRRYEVIFINSKLLEIMNCNQNDVVSMLSTITYETTATSVYLIEEIDNYLESSSQDPKIFGPVTYRQKSLSIKCSKISVQVSDALILVITDITKYKNLEESLKKQNQDEYMLRSVAHELRSPINSIIFFSDKNMQAVDKSCRMHENLKIINNNSQYLLNIVNDILDYSRIKSGNFKIINQEFNPSKLIRDTIKLFEFQAEKKNLTISVMIDPLMPKSGYSDRNRIQQILMNLLSNSVK